MALILVMCTCPPGNTAEHLAKLLVEEKMAACVNRLDGVKSVYNWQGKTQQDAETLLLIKTSDTIWPQLEQAIIRHHPYDVPEIIALPIVAGNQDYLNWVEDSLCTD